MIITIHPTGLCNQSCPYCTTYKSADVMSKDTLVNTLDFVNRIQAKTNDGYIEFHSAEPTMVGIPFFENAINVMESLGITNRCLLATNMTSDAWQQNISNWCAFLSENNWAVNVSLDGPEHIHDSHRGVGTWRKVIESIIKIKEYNIQYGTIAVIVDGQEMDEVYDFFVSAQENVQLNPVMPHNNVGGSLCRVFDRWIADEKPIQIDPFSRVFKYLTSQRFSHECHTTCGHDLVSIDPDGYVRPCGFFWDNTKLKDLFVYGNVNTDSYDDIWFGDTRRTFLEYVNCKPYECLQCPWLNYCGGGCSYCNFSGADHCGHIKQLLEHAAWLRDN